MNNTFKSYAKKYHISTIQNDGYVLDMSLNPKQMYRLIICKPHKNENQQFYLTPTQNGKWRINCIMNAFCLRAKTIGNEIILIFEKPCGDSLQQWQLLEISPNVYTFKAYNGKVIDVAGGTYKNDAKPILYSSHHGPNQQWNLKPV